MSKWQPIETAPKDGSKVLLWDSDERKYGVSAWLSQEREHWDQVNATTRKRRVEVWGYWPDIDFCPTHWMPLPEPPQ